MFPPVAPLVAPIVKGKLAFNGHAVRLCIASSSDYIAHPVFPEQVKWSPVSNTNNVLCYDKILYADGSPMPANLMIVGVVSLDRPYLGDLGNWNSAINMKPSDIKQQFTLMRPTGFVHFEDDYDLALHRLTTLQDAIAQKGSQPAWFILGGNTLRMSHRLFHEKLDIPDESSDMEEEEIALVEEARAEANERALASKQYTIRDRDMQETVNKLLQDYDLIPLEAYSRSNEVIPTDQLSRSLKGALVQVIFNLHSNYVTFQKVTNFKGQLVQVKILKNSTNIPTSPRRKGPIRLQTAQLRDDQVEAVNTFLFQTVSPPIRNKSVTIKDEADNGEYKAPVEGSSSNQISNFKGAGGLTAPKGSRF